MVYRPGVEANLAFVLMPFKPPFDSYYEEIIRPAARAAGLECRKADEIYGTGPIIHDIWKQIWAATAIIADVTGRNPNVNYELGICHTLNVPTVIITQNFDDVPFDYRHRRCIPYDTKDVNWQRTLKKTITATLKQVLAGEDVFPELSWPYETKAVIHSQLGVPLVPAADSRAIVFRGAQLVRDAVAHAFGPHGTNVSLNVGQDQQRYFKRGADISRAIHSPERLEEIGIDHARFLASEMITKVGDGSKTALLIFQKMLDSGHAALKRNHPPDEILRGMERSVETIMAIVRSQSRPATRSSLIQVAQTAAAGNKGIAAAIVEAYAKAGRDGVVVIEQNSSPETTLEVEEGMNFDRGYIDRGFVSEAGAKECVLENAYVLLSELKIGSMKDFLPLLEDVAKSQKPLLVIADDVEGEALATLLLNQKKGTLNCVAVKAPGFADRRGALLQDIAVLTGANVLTHNSGRKLEGVTQNDLGRAQKVIVTKDSTTILGGAGEANVAKHVEGIRDELARSVDQFTIEKLRERLAKLSGAIAAVRVGGFSIQDVTDATYRAESAMHSVQKAIEEGTVTGGGLSLLRSQSALKKLSFRKAGEIAGVEAVASAVEEPIRQLLLNNGLIPDAELKRIRRTRTTEVGFNSDTGKLEDLNAVGVLDPVATITHALRLAFSHARTLLATAAWDTTTTSNRSDLSWTARQECAKTIKPSNPDRRGKIVSDSQTSSGTMRARKQRRISDVSLRLNCFSPWSTALPEIPGQ